MPRIGAGAGGRGAIPVTERCPVAGDRAHLPAEIPGRRGRPRIWPAADHRGDLVPGPHRVRLAVLPADFPPWQTVYSYFATWRDEAPWPGCTPLRAQVRTRLGARRPTAAVSIRSPCGRDTVPRQPGWERPRRSTPQAPHRRGHHRLVLDVVITPPPSRPVGPPLLWNTHRACRHVACLASRYTASSRLAATLKIPCNRAKRTRTPSGSPRFVAPSPISTPPPPITPPHNQLQPPPPPPPISDLQEPELDCSAPGAAPARPADT